jgi:hypothetical protein
LARPGVKPKTQNDESAANQDEPSSDTAEPQAVVMKSAGYKEWLKKEGSAFRDFPRRGSPWLGGDVPFPFNPTFKPPPPIGQGVRDAIFFSHSVDPEKNDVRALSARFGISIKRIEAIIRLKSLEEVHRKDKRPLQTGFLAGMEYYLRVPTSQRTVSPGMNTPIDLTDRLETQDGDFAADSMTSNSNTSQRVTRSYFEMVDEGSRPVVPDAVDAHHQKQLQHQEARRINSDAQPSFIYKAPGAPPSRGLFEFVDVGNKFSDRKDMKIRDKEAARRRLVRTRRQGRSEGATSQSTPNPPSNQSSQTTATLT